MVDGFLVVVNCACLICCMFAFFDIDTLGVFARSLQEEFAPLCVDCANMAMALLQNATDPDLRRCM